MPKSEDKQVRCSFCGKHQDQVGRLIAGPNVYICNECVELCNGILRDDLDLDVLGYLDEIPVCVGYDINGEVTTDFPVTAKLEKAKEELERLYGIKVLAIPADISKEQDNEAISKGVVAVTLDIISLTRSKSSCSICFLFILT